MITKICEQCQKEFKTDNKNRRFCGHKCADTRHGESLKTLKPKNCENCGKEFQPKNYKTRFCCKKCGDEAKIKWHICEGCGGKFKSKGRGTQKYCSKECYYKYRDYKFCSPGQRASKENDRFKKLLEYLGYTPEIEFHLGKYYYDFKIGDILIEVNPYPYHNCTRSPTKKVVIGRDYHYNKYKYAIDNGYKCIMVWDWTINLLDMLKDKSFHYEGLPQLHYYNPKTKEHIIDEGLNKDEMITNGFVEIWDCGKETFSLLL